MVSSADEILQTVRSNPFIDGIGYFIEATTVEPVSKRAAEELTRRMQEDFCMQSQVTVEGENVLGFDFHEHIITHGEDGAYALEAVERLLKHVERKYGLEHLCIEFQFDLVRARSARRELDELLKP